MIGHTTRAEMTLGRPVADLPALTQRALAALDDAADAAGEYRAAVAWAFADALELPWDDVLALVERAAEDADLGDGLRDHPRHRFTERLDELLCERAGGQWWPDELPWRLAHAATAYLRPERDDDGDDEPPVPRGTSTDPATWVARP